MKCPSQFFMHTYDSTTNILPLDGLGRIQVWVQQDAQLSQRDRAAGCVIVFAKSRRLELGDNILRTV